MSVPTSRAARCAVSRVVHIFFCGRSLFFLKKEEKNIYKVEDLKNENLILDKNDKNKENYKNNKNYENKENDKINLSSFDLGNEINDDKSGIKTLNNDINNSFLLPKSILTCTGA